MEFCDTVLWDIRMLQQRLWAKANLTFLYWIQFKIKIPLVSEGPLSSFPVTVVSKNVSAPKTSHSPTYKYYPQGTKSNQVVYRERIHNMVQSELSSIIFL